MTKLTAKRLLTHTTAALALFIAIGAASPVRAANDIPFTISMDGKRVDSSADVARVLADENKAISGTDIQVSYDGLMARPVLNVSTYPAQVNFRSGDTVKFLGSFNYAAWIARAEVRIFDRANLANPNPLYVVPLNRLGAAEWRMPAGAPNDMEYVLRVYDPAGRFDETLPLPIRHSASNLAVPDTANAAPAPGYGEDRTAFRNISVIGGAINVFGKNVPAGHEVTVMGEPVPVDGNGSFTVQRLVPTGHTEINVAVLQEGKGLNFTREVTIPENEWFGVGIADLTLGHNFGNGIVEHTGVDEFPGTWTQGHAAFYLKGKIKGQYLLTASADTGEGTLQDMFTGLDGKDPRAMLKRINPNDYYPVYGDDSTMRDDAPTSGKFYVRIERGPSSAMWGNFKTNITGTKFMASQQALYGASGVYRSDEVTRDGNAKRAVDVYAAQPATVPETDLFRGTGGSAYFLKHQDITIGSDVVSVEQRNPITGFVISTTQLTASTDYRIDPVNGVIILNAPLPSSNGAGNENYLVVHYTYQPVASDTNAYVYGGRAETWVGDHVRLGVSGLRQKEQTADQTMYGGDVRVQSSPKTYVEGEVAHSEGPGFGSTYSADGGLSTQTTVGAGVTGVPANAWRVEGAASLDEVSKDRMQGQMQGRFEHYDAGFSSPSENATTETIKWGVAGDVKTSSTTAAKGEYSENNQVGQNLLRAGKAAVDVGVSHGWTIEPYAKYAEQEGTALANTQIGARGDAGVKLIRDFDRDHQAYVFAQGTVALSGTMQRDDRAGVGFRSKINDRITASGEASYGDLGPDLAAAIEYAATADDRYTLGYRRDAYRSTLPGTPYALSGIDFGVLTAGIHHKLNDQWSTFAETSFDYYGDRRSLTDALGVKYTPTPEWTLESDVQFGRVFDNTINPTTHLKNPNLYRDAVSASAMYQGKNGLEGKAKGELRWDLADDGSSEVMAYLIQLGLGAKMSKDWRALANLDAVWSNSSDTTKQSAYVNGLIGFAYRPADNDRVNALVKYNFVYDAPGSGQVTLDGTTTSPMQISHIFSGDVTYNITPKLALGAKYGFRIGEIQERTAGSVWTDSSAHLGILRADYHIVNAWDALLEARALWSPTDGTTDYGFVAAIYRQVTDHFRVGVGYNFGDFSDDLAHISHDNHGVFINATGTF